MNTERFGPQKDTDEHGTPLEAGMTSQCAACGSKRVLYRTRLVARPLPGIVLLDIPPVTALGTSQSVSEVRGVTCVDCGHIQFAAIDLDVLKAAYVKQQEGSLQLG